MKCAHVNFLPVVSIMHLVHERRSVMIFAVELRLARASVKVENAGFTRHSARRLSSRWIHPLSETPEQEGHTEIGKQCYAKDLLGRIVDREQNQLSESETVTLFEDLVTFGLEVHRCRQQNGIPPRSRWADQSLTWHLMNWTSLPFKTRCFAQEVQQVSATLTEFKLWRSSLR